MNTDLSFITNEENISLKERFRVLIKDTSFFDCLVGYFYSSGFHAIYPALKNTEKIRILIGISTNRQTFEMMQMEGPPIHQSFDFSHAQAKQEIENLVEAEMADSEDNQNTLKWLNALGDELINSFKVLATLQTHIPARLLQSHYAEQSPSVTGKREVILSLYLAGD